MTNAAVLTIGNELLSGQVVDTNGARIATTLRALGLEVTCHMTCADDLDDIGRALAFCAERAKVIVTSGGLGPTEDDLTHEAVARFAGVEVELRDEVLETIRERFESRGVPMPRTNERSARLPRGAEPLPNPNGTAPGAATKAGDLLIISLPGPPRELEPMLRDAVEPLLRRELSLAEIVGMRVVRVFGLSESRLAMKIASVPKPGPGFHLGYRPVFPEIHLVMAARGSDEQEVSRQLDAFEAGLRERVGPWIYGTGEESLAAVVGKLLLDRGWTLATVESCTGGLVSKLVTDVPGSSGWFDRGFVTYTNEAKQRLVGVPPDIFEAGGPGAVSERCALEMARGAREASGADVAVSTTGIAGPDGGTLSKPVGTVWIGLATSQGANARAYRFPGDRDWVRTLTAFAALERLRRALLGLPEFEAFSLRSDRR